MTYALVDDLEGLTQADPAMLVDLASRAVDDYVGRPLAVAEYTETFTPGDRRLWLVSAGWTALVDSVVEDGVELTADDWTLSTDGALDRAEGSWGDEVVVTYTTGFAVDSTQMATAKRIVLQLASMGSGNPQGLASIQLDGATPSFVVAEGGHALPPLTLTETQKADLDRFRWRRRLA